MQHVKISWIKMILVIKSIAFHVNELRMKCALYIQAQTFSGEGDPQWSNGQRLRLGIRRSRVRISPPPGPIDFFWGDGKWKQYSKHQFHVYYSINKRALIGANIKKKKNSGDKFSGLVKLAKLTQVIWINVFNKVKIKGNIHVYIM